MHALLIAQTNNRKGKRDGDEFIAQAKRCGQWWVERDEWNTWEMCGIDRKKTGAAGARNAVYAAIEDQDHIDMVGFFCHGFPWGLSLGINHRWRHGDTSELAKRLAVKCGDRLRVGLFACSCARGMNRDADVRRSNRWEPRPDWREGFAMHLCGELAHNGVQADVLAHFEPGHTTRNRTKAMCYPLSGIIRREKLRIPEHVNRHRYWPFDMMMK
jgi:hypothetical protein